MAHRAPHFSLLLCVCSSLALAACDRDEPVDPQDMTLADMSMDSGPSTQDMPDEEADADSGPLTQDMEPDAPAEDAAADLDEDMPQEFVCAPFASPSLGTFAQATALAAMPERCQQPAYQWLDDPTLGDIVQTQEGQRYDAATLRLLAQAGGIELPLELDYDVEVSTIEYVTQDRGELVTATAFVTSPVPRASQRADFKTLVYLHGTSGFTDGCGPSSDDETLLLSAAIASAGYVVVGPDYLGMKSIGEPSPEVHPYLVGESVAMSSIDAVRAVGKMGLFEEFGACASSELLLLGGSQGGHAALWFDRLLPYYAPEFELLGTVATVPPADLVGQTSRALGAPVQASANVMAFWGSSGVWYGFGDRFDEVFVPPYDMQIPAALTASCNPSDSVQLDVMNLTDVFTSDALSWADALTTQPTWGCMTAQNGLTTTDIARPGESASYADTYGILWVMGELDQLVHTPIEREAFTELCQQGMTMMQYLECEGASHTGATAWALPEILEFLQERGERAPLPTQGLCELTAPQRCQGTPDE